MTHKVKSMMLGNRKLLISCTLILMAFAWTGAQALENPYRSGEIRAASDYSFHHSVAITIGMGNPIFSVWHELYPNYCTEHQVIDWEDNDDGVLSPCDQIEMIDVISGERKWYHVEEVTITIFVTKKPELTEGMYVDYEDGYEYLYDAIEQPVSTQWHELYPDFCNSYHLEAWEDNGDQHLSPSDQIQLTDKVTQDTAWYHVEEVTTDIILWEKPSATHTITTTTTATVTNRTTITNITETTVTRTTGITHVDTRTTTVTRTRTTTSTTVSTSRTTSTTVKTSTTTSTSVTTSTSTKTVVQAVWIYWIIPIILTIAVLIITIWIKYEIHTGLPPRTKPRTTPRPHRAPQDTPPPGEGEEPGPFTEDEEDTGHDVNPAF